MTIATLTEPRIVSIDVTGQAIVAHLADGRTVGVPLEWSWRLKDATPEQRTRWEIIGGGQGVHWPDIDEDISVDGMLRGVPAKRPSRTEMRVLLDASSLIDAEHGKPNSLTDLDKMLRRQHARLILTYTNVLEFAAPFEKTGDHIALRSQLQRIEQLPIGYLREGGIKIAELREAVKAFCEKRECNPIDPYGTRWDETLAVEGPPPAEMLVNQSLYDLVSVALKRGSPIRHAEERWGDLLRKQFDADRELSAETRNAVGAHFRETVRRCLDQFSIDFPPEQVGELADWILANPAARCPGYRLAWEVRRDVMKNLSEKVSGNDMFDIAHVRAVPYVDAVTMDRNTAAHCRNVAKRLKKIDSAINYEQRIFASLGELLRAKF